MVSRQICTCGAQGSDLLWGIPATHSVQAWIPLMVFEFLFGLPMDYEVFVLSRMREEYDPTGSTTAVVEALRRTGRLVASSALIPVLAFISMASAPGTDIKMFATALAAGSFLDAPSSAGIAAGRQRLRRSRRGGRSLEDVRAVRYRGLPTTIGTSRLTPGGTRRAASWWPQRAATTGSPARSSRRARSWTARRSSRPPAPPSKRRWSWSAPPPHAVTRAAFAVIS